MPRPSTIKALPPDILERLQELLRDPRVSQLEVTARINDLLAAEGYDLRVSKSAVNRYAVQMEEVGAKLRQSREIAAMWIGKLGAAPQGQVGHLLNEIVRNMAFDAAMRLAEGEEPVHPKLIKELALAVARLEIAASSSVKRESEIRRQERERLAESVDAVGEEAQREKLTPGQVLDRVKAIYRGEA